MEKALQTMEAKLAPDGLTYLATRGIHADTALRHRLGVVSSDSPDLYHKYMGRLAIPYLDRMGVYGFKFRCLAHGDCKTVDCMKYLNPADQEVGVYNVLALDDDESDTLYVTEGEMDAVCLSQFATAPVIGTPGSGVWKDHWVCHFSGFERVVCWKHGDRAGDKWAKRLRDVCRNAEIVELPQGEDVNSLLLSWGPEKVLYLAEGGDDE